MNWFHGRPSDYIRLSNMIEGVTFTALQKKDWKYVIINLHIGWRFFWPPSRRRIRETAEELFKAHGVKHVMHEIALRW